MSLVRVQPIRVSVRTDWFTGTPREILVDGRRISVPLAWDPRLLHATVVERANWRILGRGEGIRWPDLDEDIEIQHLVDGRLPVKTTDPLAVA